MIEAERVKLALHGPRKMALQAAQKASVALLAYLGMLPDQSNICDVVDRNAALILAVPLPVDKTVEPILVHDAGAPSWLSEDDGY